MCETIGFDCQNGTRAEIRSSRIMLSISCNCLEVGQKEGRRSVNDSLIMSKPFHHLCLHSLIIPWGKLGRAPVCIPPGESCPHKFYYRNSVLLACVFLEAGICFLVLFSFSQRLVGDKCTDDWCNSVSVSSRAQRNNFFFLNVISGWKKCWLSLTHIKKCWSFVLAWIRQLHFT